MAAELATSLTATEAQRLEQAEALVRGFCGWHIAPSREGETYTVRTSGGRDIFLPSMYVTAVDSVTEADVPLTADDEYTWLAPSGILRRNDYWAHDELVVVTFTHGYAAPPAEVTAIVQAIAQRAVDNARSLKSKSIGPFSEAYSTPSALSLLDSEKEILRSYRIPTVA